jgi:hypothetical protein
VRAHERLPARKAFIDDCHSVLRKRSVLSIVLRNSWRSLPTVNSIRQADQRDASAAHVIPDQLRDDPHGPGMVRLAFFGRRLSFFDSFVQVAKKSCRKECCVPIQGVYEPMLPEAATQRYQLVVDGEDYSEDGLSRSRKKSVTPT